jgi:hypothetical protein
MVVTRERERDDDEAINRRAILAEGKRVLM